MPDRRTILWSMLASPALGSAAPAGAAGWGQEFTIRRNGSPIGWHRLRFQQDGPRLAVDIDIEIEVKLAFITVYRYRHTNRELWDDSRLMSFTSRTDENGTPHRVEARRAGDGLVVDGDQGRIEAPGDAVPSTYWHRRLLDRRRWIDTQGGRLLRCAISPRGVEQVDAAGRTVAADRFAVTGDLTLDLWYDRSQWVGLAFPGPDGSPIDYRLERGDRPASGAPANAG